jgi:hypothetical protein
VPTSSSRSLFSIRRQPEPFPWIHINTTFRESRLISVVLHRPIETTPLIKTSGAESVIVPEQRPQDVGDINLMRAGGSSISYRPRSRNRTCARRQSSDCLSTQIKHGYTLTSPFPSSPCLQLLVVCAQLAKNTGERQSFCRTSIKSWINVFRQRLAARSHRVG